MHRNSHILNIVGISTLLSGLEASKMFKGWLLVRTLGNQEPPFNYTMEDMLGPNYKQQRCLESTDEMVIVFEKNL